MPRVARIVLSGLPHHITQRGNNRQDVFFVADDYRVYLELLREQGAKSARVGRVVSGRSRAQAAHTERMTVFPPPT